MIKHLYFLLLAIYEIKNIQTGKNLAAKQSKVIISDVSGNAAKWQWVPKEKSKVWGFIQNVKYEKYLTVSKCTNKVSPCTLKAIKLNGKEEQHWRKWDKKIISKKQMKIKDKVLLLTLDSDNATVIAKSPDDGENQEWELN